ncbi:hypothetical protein SCUCBS95973_003676 [Sporothrix curviconia]|uniref:ACB domain-containing protein n=1 Tax=Sporothrix curviconia TaxID=1260050 RepID=A0ABP0BHM1_9PEZI
MTLQQDFEQAALDVRKLTQKPSPKDLLKLYALYKVGTGADISQAKAPGMFEIQAKAMRREWQDLVDTEITQEDAQKAYIDKVKELKETHGFDLNKEPEAVRS